MEHGAERTRVYFLWRIRMLRVGRVASWRSCLCTWHELFYACQAVEIARGNSVAVLWTPPFFQILCDHVGVHK